MLVVICCPCCSSYVATAGPCLLLGGLPSPFAIISTLLTSSISMLCNTHVFYGLHVLVLHSLHEAQTIRCNRISTALTMGTAAPVFAMKKTSVPVSRNTRLVGQSPKTRPTNTHVVHTHMCCSLMTSKACRGRT